MKRALVTTLVMLLCLSTITVKAEDKKTLKARIESMTAEQKEARIVEIKQRVDAINSMDRSTLAKEERKELKKELKELNQEARAIGGGIYLSTAAVIIIILLLIILL